MASENAKKAYQMEYRAQKAQFYKRKIEEIKEEMLMDPLGERAQNPLKGLISEFPADEKIIIEAWKEVMGI